ncbi:MAG: glycosyltransferase family 39 protein [Sphingobacteriia bacterium]|nr:glycosyltransferase family 39 protein [Sphingobacteriia bacterium]
MRNFPGWIIILILCSVLFIPFLGSISLFDWDEINFAESAREMLLTKNFLQVTINYLPFYEKPPLFFWMQAFAMYTLGVNEWAARIPNVFAAFATLYMLYVLGKYLQDELTGKIMVALYLAAWLPNFYFRTGIIDPWFNFWIIAALLCFLAGNEDGNSKSLMYFLGSGVFSGLAVLTKGPVALLMIGLSLIIYFIMRKKWPNLKFWLGYSFSLFLILSGWLGTLTYLYGTDFLFSFIQYQIELFTQPVAGHEQPFYYHFVVIALGCFPMSFLFFNSFRYVPVDYKKRNFSLLMKILFWVVLIVFSISKTKIVHYSSLCWIPGGIITGIYLRDRWKEIYANFLIRKIIPYWMLSIGILILIAGIGLPYLKYTGIQDKFLIAGLNGPVYWTGFEAIPGLCLTLGGIYLLLFKSTINIKPWLYSQAAITSLFLLSLGMFLAPRIAEITQEPAIRFYKSMQGKRVLLITEGFKSYAHYFYGAVQPPDNINLQDINTCLQGNIDRPIWMVVRKDRIKEDFQDKYPLFNEVFKSGGFVFFVRKP